MTKKAVIKLVNPARLKVGDYVCMVHTPDVDIVRARWGMNRRALNREELALARKQMQPRLISGRLASIETFGSKWIARIVFAVDKDGKAKQSGIEYSKGQLAMLLLGWRYLGD